MQTNSASPIDLSAPPRSLETGHKSRHVADLSKIPLLGRTALMSRIQQAASQAPSGTRFPIWIALLQFWKWLLPYLHDYVHKKVSYRTYPNGSTGVFSIAPPPGSGPVRIAVTADWGTGTLEAAKVAENIRACSPHYTLHLGDLYYMGEASEIRENCLGTAMLHSGGRWPTGSMGSFSLMGNHEMYSGGQGYFDTFLATLGLLNDDRTVKTPQTASYFCLEAEHWLVLGLDTGYHSGGVPIFTSIPGLNRIPFFNVDARFDGKMLAWLKQTISLAQAESSPPKSILLLTHHQPISSFEHFFQKPAAQLAQLGFLNGQDLVWLYGHEHRLTVYNKQTLAGSLRVHPRCIGHGGMPVEVTKLSQPDPTIRYYDPRDHPMDKDNPNTRVGYNGHILLLIDGPRLTIEYHDIIDNSLLFTETFTPSGNGALQYESSMPSGSQLRSGQETT